MKIEDGAKLYLDGKRALNSKNSNISGKGVFHIKDNMIHEGDNGVNLTPAAIGLYRKYGFIETGRRKNYYPLPEGGYEDAILMEKPC